MKARHRSGDSIDLARFRCARFPISEGHTVTSSGGGGGGLLGRYDSVATSYLGEGDLSEEDEEDEEERRMALEREALIWPRQEFSFC